MSEQEVKQIFDHFDRDKNGTIEASEIKTVLGEMGKVLSDEEAAQLLKGADVNSDGKVSFEEFLKMLQSIH